MKSSIFLEKKKRKTPRRRLCRTWLYFGKLFQRHHSRVLRLFASQVDKGPGVSRTSTTVRDCFSWARKEKREQVRCDNSFSSRVYCCSHPETAMNLKSSRAHTVIIVHQSRAAQDEMNDGSSCRNLLCLVDLGGAEQGVVFVAPSLFILDAPIPFT